MTTRLIVKKKGITENTPLLVLHGWGMNSSAWDSVAEAFEQHFLVSWLDLPGHGNNRSIQAKNLTEIIALILPLITKPTHIVGWSLGGLIAQELIRQRPKLIKGVVMVASTPRFSQATHWNHAISEKILSAFAEGLKKDSKGTIKRFITLQFMQISHTQTLQKQLKNTILQNMANREALNVGLQILQQQDFTQIPIRQPQLWLFGEKDRLIPIEMIKDLSRLHPNAMIEKIADAGHAPFMTHPQQFIDRVVPFLKKVT